MDFTLSTYSNLLNALKQQGFFFQTFCEYLVNPAEKAIILRHDVDLLPGNSLATAKLEQASGISGSYYFRMVPESYDETIIRQIAHLGHEIGYHYEDLASADGNLEKAYDSFCRNLEKLRTLCPVTTICMHGSPLSKWDSRLLWGKYSYRSHAITGEPYFDLDFNKTFYLTDTGRRWDGHKVSIRDKAMASAPVTNPGFLGRSYHSTKNIIDAVQHGTFPGRAMITLHPQRWTSSPIPWIKELLAQNLKNQVKRFLVK
ncbi:MAG: hypothetical protein NT040_02430 [Bacteroidetes bacterium]|nr:hypothetical protein [Bacteroidota bacterium]